MTPPDSRLARLEAEVEHLERRDVEFKDALRDVERRLGRRIDACGKSIAGVRQAIESQSTARADARVKIVVAVIAGSATVLAALATAVAIVLTSSG